eukprot:gene1087-biopygen22744
MKLHPVATSLDAIACKRYPLRERSAGLAPQRALHSGFQRILACFFRRRTVLVSLLLNCSAEPADPRNRAPQESVGRRWAGRAQGGGGGGVCSRSFHESPRGTLLWHAPCEFTPRCEPHPARAEWGPMIRMGSGSSLAFQRLSPTLRSSILSVRLASGDLNFENVRSPTWCGTPLPA